MNGTLPSTSQAPSSLAECHPAKKKARHWFDAWAGSYDRSLLNFFLFRPCYLAMLQEVAAWRAERDKRHAGETPATVQRGMVGGADATMPRMVGEAHPTKDQASGGVPVAGERGPERFRLLDVGCGTASFAKLLTEIPWPIDVVGMDYSPAMCAVAAKKLASTHAQTRAAVLAGDSEHLPFADGSVDVITCANSFHHYPRQGAVIREMRRVLRPGGRLILLDGFRDNVIGWFVFDVVVTWIEKDVHHATWREVHTLFVEAGFRNIRRRKFNVLFPVLVTTGDA